MPHLDELRRLAPPPSEPVPLPAHGVTVPADYLDLVATYGQGELCDLVHLELGGLLPWGATSNGDLLCWLTDGDPDTWPTVVWTCAAASSRSTSWVRPSSWLARRAGDQ